IFCTLTEGIRSQRAKEWRLIDDYAKPQAFAEKVKARATELAAQSDRPSDAKGIALTPLKRTIDEAGYHYETVDVTIDRAARRATLTVKAPAAAVQSKIDDIVAAGAAWWPLQMARELDDAILMLRTNDLDIGTWVLKTTGDATLALGADAVLDANRGHWFVRETIGMLRRTLARLDVTSRTLIALVERGSCFAGTLAELLFAADRGYMLALPDAPAEEGKVTLSAMNFGDYPMVNAQYRLAARFYGEEGPLAAAKAAIGQPQGADAALALGLVTATPDDLDWEDEIRIVLEERASLSPDALTGMEANLRFGPGETMETRVFGRLSAWQNWIFIRPNAVGEGGALKVFGSGNKAKFDWNRV
ncbi:MAG: benzoyl-CoA-dihydrodiol lyase, partial [Sterolibacteriaceae bacterium]|nr:benzoyl-CoA-dihydrodiol lyase [Sterolibacteriaceae bacterium]